MTEAVKKFDVTCVTERAATEQANILQLLKKVEEQYPAGSVYAEALKKSILKAYAEQEKVTSYISSDVPTLAADIATKLATKACNAR